MLQKSHSQPPKLDVPKTRRKLWEITYLSSQLNLWLLPIGNNPWDDLYSLPTWMWLIFYGKLYNRPMDSHGLESFNFVAFCWGCLLLILGSEQFGYEQSSCPWEIAPQVKHQIFWLLSVGLFCLLLLLFETLKPSCLLSKLSLDEPFFVGLYNWICWKSWLKSLNFFIFGHARVAGG